MDNLGKRRFRMKHPKNERDLNRIVAEVVETRGEEHEHKHYGEYSINELLSAIATTLQVLEHEIGDIKIRIRVIENKIDQIFETITDFQKKINTIKRYNSLD